MSYREYFPTNLCAILKRRGWSQRDLAYKLNVSPTSVNAWCTGEKFPRIDMLQKISEALDVTLTALMSAKGPNRGIAEIDDSDRLEALHQNPRLGLLFDKTRKMSDADIDMMIKFVERMLDERD